MSYVSFVHQNKHQQKHTLALPLLPEADAASETACKMQATMSSIPCEREVWMLTQSFIQKLCNICSMYRAMRASKQAENKGAGQKKVADWGTVAEGREEVSTLPEGKVRRATAAAALASCSWSPSCSARF